MPTQNSINNQVLDNNFTVDNGTIEAGTGLTVTTGNADILAGSLNVGTASPSIQFEITVEKSVAGNMGVYIVNTSSSTSADALIQIQTEAGAGDPLINFITNGGQTWSLGLDNSDSDALKINDGSSPSTGTNTWKMTQAGERTMPLQPAFLARLTNTQSNVTGNNTVYTVTFDTVIFNQNGDYDGTNTFTAPISGRYLLCGMIRAAQVTGGTVGSLRFITSNHTYISYNLDYDAIQTPTSFVAFNMSILADMDALDTAEFAIVINGIGADTVDINGTELNYFSGHLVC